ncbi:hypothetical protein LZ32DRAFT_220358 [Colletotrichum eremochloae]|nr:hypothetical protein LZ32DRAFT_220358 [Colletotrichum eremochloae]
MESRHHMRYMAMRRWVGEPIAIVDRSTPDVSSAGFGESQLGRGAPQAGEPGMGCITGP